MSLTVYEKFNGRKRKVGLKPSIVIDLFVIRDAVTDPEFLPNYDDAIQAVNEFLPATIIDDFTGVQMNLSEIGITEQLSEVIVAAQFAYNSDEVSKPAGGCTYNFEAIAGSQKMYQSLKTISRHAYGDSYGGGNIAPDYHGAIGVNLAGDPEGVDVILPTYKFSETWTMDARAITDAYKDAIFQTAGTTNKNTFRHFAPGEALFAGARGSTRQDGKYEVSFEFLASPNVTSLTIGTIDNISKKGWEYVWVSYVKGTAGDGANNRISPKPTYAYVEQLYPESDFSVLAIGT